ncbi:M15 family metallopeptidase [Nakamurella alba]|nr:M15 family metallopeptidase [Nakamurella alba]
MSTSWRAGCPVPLSELTYLTMTYRGFDGEAHTGEMVVATAVADDVVEVFRQLYAAGFPIARMRLVDDFGGDDDASMAADNTSAFNCRRTTSGSGWSQHSYGRAIDINPVENPYLSDDLVLPTDEFVDRPEAPGVIRDGDACVQAFASVGWSWGGDWSDPVDYQHFSQNGR